MDVPARLQVIHQPVRLRVMTLLFKHGDIGFTEAHKLLDVTPGNMDGHVKTLEQEGFLTSRRALMKDHFEVRLRITPAGTGAFEEYLGLLRGFLARLE